MRIALLLQCDLVGVTSLQPTGKDFQWGLKIQCSSCHEDHKNTVFVCGDDEVDMPGGRGVANVVVKCSFCNRQNSLDIVPDSERSCCESGVPEPMVVLDCRGVDIIDFDPGSGWKCRGIESNSLFHDIDLSEGDWADYDEKASDAVSIENIITKVEAYNEKKNSKLHARQRK